MSQNLVSPLPPLAGEDLPHIGAGLRFLDAPTAYLQELRARHGDTFLVDVFGFDLLMTFAPKGLESLYRLDEAEASFGQATFDLTSFKTPGEIYLDIDPDLFRQLLLQKRLPSYVATMVDIVDRELERWLERWGDGGAVDIFDAIRTLEQRVGFALWICQEAAEDRHWPDLKRSFDVLDQERAFVSPQETLATIKSNKSRERAAVEEIKRKLDEITQEHDRNPHKQAATIDFLRDRYSAEEAQDCARKVAHNTINANQGFLSNLYAAIAWVIVRLVQYPAILEKVGAEIAAVRERFGADFATIADALNEMQYLEQVMMESVRMAQRSITLRKVMAPVAFDDGVCTYTVQPGVYIATMLSVTNTETDALARFDPDHYNRIALSSALTPQGKETVSTFGHGRHACPAQRFSHHMCKIVVSRILDRFELESQFDDPQPSARQLGGVARPDQPVKIGLRRRA